MTIGCNDFTARERDGHGHGRGCGALEPGPWSASWNWRSDQGDGQEAQACAERIRSSRVQWAFLHAPTIDTSVTTWCSFSRAFRICPFKLQLWLLLPEKGKILCQSIIPTLWPDLSSFLWALMSSRFFFLEDSSPPWRSVYFSCACFACLLEQPAQVVNIDAALVFGDRRCCRGCRRCFWGANRRSVRFGCERGSWIWFLFFGVLDVVLDEEEEEEEEAAAFISFS
jgi:hypothetical protein